MLIWHKGEKDKVLKTTSVTGSFLLSDIVEKAKNKTS